MIRGHMRGAGRLLKKLRDYDAQTKERVSTALKRGAVAVHRTALDSIKRGAKTGIHHKGLPNRSSAPGQAPATQSNQLADSLRIVNDEKSKLVVYVVASAPHAKHMEFGTVSEDGKQIIAPRPFLRPALAKHRDTLNREIRRAWEGKQP